MKLRHRLSLLILIFGWSATHYTALADSNEVHAKQLLEADSIDIDGNGEFDALTDGLLLLRSMFELTGSPLISDVIGSNAVYSSADEIEYRISSIESDLDIDNDGRVDALTDGLLILRYLFELSGEPLVSNVISSNAQRILPDDIELYLDSLATHNITFTSNKYFSTPENQKEIGNVSVIDSDGGFFYYSLSGADSASLSINSITGALFFNQPPDYELRSSYQVVAQVADGINSNIQTITISVTDLDDVSPTFTSNSAFIVPENQTEIGLVTVSDVDSESTLYSVSGNEIIISSDGVLTFVANPDFEERNSYTTTVTASDGINQTEQAVTINVNDVNDVAPIITSGAFFTTIVAPDVETMIGTVTAIDTDSERLRFRIASSELTIAANGSLSFLSEPNQNTNTSYSGIVTVTDGIFSATQNITVTTEYDFDGDGSADNRDPDDDNDGVPDNIDDFPADPHESLDTDGDGVGNNDDSDDDNDGVADENDEYPLDAGNVIDSDGDGVVDRNDVFPNDDNLQKALSIDFTGATSLGLGEVINANGSSSVLNLFDPRELDNSVFSKVKDFFINKAWANQVTLSSLTNIINWDVEGSEILDTILSNETLFIAGADVTPDGKYLYLLTSAHIQSAIPNLDQEVCSIYRVNLDDYAFECLLNTADGDIQPRSLNPHITLDFSRGNIVFRSDGAALVHGFNWKQLDEDPLSNGVALGSVWIMSSEGLLTPIPKENGFEVNLAVWVNDNYLATHEWFFDGENLSQERIAVYDASTLERVKVVEADGASLGVIKFDGDLYWWGASLNGDTLELQDYPLGNLNLPIVDTAGKRLYGFTNTNGSSNKIESADGSIVLSLTDGVGGAGGYNYQKQSGVGTGIKYSAFNFTDKYIGYMKIYAPETSIVSIDGNQFGANQKIALTDDRGYLEIQYFRDIFLITPSDSLVGDLVIDYVVDANGVNESRQLVITEQTIGNWRADENRGSWLEWASPEPDQEGFCVYSIEVDANQCVKLEDYSVLTTDMESFRSTRYDANPVYPNGTGNAFPGLQSILFTGDELRVYFKDTSDHQYYQASAGIEEFIATGKDVLAFSKAENGSGESNIITQGISLKPLEIKSMAVTVTESASQELTINFAQSLSAYAPLPSFEVWNGIQAVPLAEEVEWSASRDTAIIRATTVGWTGGLENEVRVLDPLFIVDSIQRYEPESKLIFIPNNANENSPIFESSSEFTADENQQHIGVVRATDADGDLVNYLLSGVDAALISIDVESGKLTFNGVPDYEARTSYLVTVTATDGINSSTQDLSITVLDVDDEGPAFTSAASLSAPENQTYIATVTVSDVDSSSISFSVQGSNLAITPEGILSFVSPPDYEVKNAYSGTITATDGTHSENQEITVAVTDVDDAPIFTSSEHFTVAENQTAIGTVTATDVDSELIIFSLTDSELAITSEGVLSFQTEPDYEVKTTYSATVEVTDGTNVVRQNITVTATVEVIGNQPPHFKDEWRDENYELITGPEFTIIENFQNRFGSFKPEDPENDELTMSISGTDIEIVNYDWLRFISSPDFETQSVYTATLTISDGEYSADQAITVTITNQNDNSPTFTSAETFSAIENQRAIGKVTATDADGDAVTFSMSTELVVNGDFQSGEAGWTNADNAVVSHFEVDVASAGDVSAVNLSQVMTLVADTAYEVSFKAKASLARTMVAGLGLNHADWNDATETATLTTEWQTFSYTITTTDENGVGFGDDNSRVLFDMGGEVGVVSIDDVSVKLADEVELLTNGDFQSGATGWTNADTAIRAYFEVDVESAGDVWSYNLSQVMALVPDTAYEVSFKAKASVARTMVAGLGLNHADWNHATETVALTTEWQTFTYEITTIDQFGYSFGEDDSRVLFDMGGEVGAVSIDDVSVIAPYRDLNDASLLTIDASTGDLTFETTPDYESQSVYTPTIVISDGEYSVSQNITVNIIDANDAPIFEGFVYSNTEFAAYQNQTEIYTLIATDADGDVLNYLLSGVDATLISVDIESGQLTFNSEPGYVEGTSFQVTATATDGIDSTTRDLTIYIIERDDVPPFFTYPDPLDPRVCCLSAPENQTYIAKVQAEDADWDGSSISFSVEGSNLAITPDGILSFVSAPDYEVKNSYSGTITATSGANSANQEVTVAVTDVDD